MNITLLGAAGDVTGSCYLIKVNDRQVLVDFGLFQGTSDTEGKNVLPPEIDPARLDAVVLTHAHLDHTGRLPLLAKGGYRNRIYATAATKDISQVILKDSAYIQTADAERFNRKNPKGPRREPLYTVEDVQRLMGNFEIVSYEQNNEILPGIRMRMVDAGHILGSASLEFKITEGNENKTVVFSGDLGPRGAPLLKDPMPFQKADLVFLESTYGDRNSRSLSDTIEETHAVVTEAVHERAKMLMPVFAVGRAQTMLYVLGGAFRNEKIPRFPLYLDSPMAIEALRLYREHADLFDEEALALVEKGQIARDLESLKLCPTAEDSRTLNHLDGPCLILAGSGMCTGGRILHHLRHNLSDARTKVFIVGYQAMGTLGRRLVDRAPVVHIFGEEIPVRASVHTLNGFSAHAGQADLVHWFSSLAADQPHVILTHGEDKPRATLKKILSDRYHVSVETPKFKEVITV